ncbi:hypothetical protein [Actinokineospora sp.]|uniref:hypothetical protein n=1 Tax=Actinokineospora sp. TaxID=1872133 RepID=UPI004037CC73
MIGSSRPGGPIASRPFDLDTIRRFEETGSPVIADGEQTKSSFATYPLAGLTALARTASSSPSRHL